MRRIVLTDDKSTDNLYRDSGYKADSISNYLGFFGTLLDFIGHLAL